MMTRVIEARALHARETAVCQASWRPCEEVCEICKKSAENYVRNLLEKNLLEARRIVAELEDMEL